MSDKLKKIQKLEKDIAEYFKKGGKVKQYRTLTSSEQVQLEKNKSRPSRKQEIHEQAMIALSEKD